MKLTAQVTQPGGAALTGRSDGYIEFYDNGTYLGDGTTVDELGWRAEFTISNPAPGPHSFTAAYRSLASYLDSESTHHRIDVELPAVGSPVDGEVPAWGATG